MPLRAFNVCAFLLVTTIVVQLALPFTNGGICSLPDDGDPASFATWLDSSQESTSPAIGSNDHTLPTAFPEVESQSAVHGVATAISWDPMPVVVSMTLAVFPVPHAILAERLSTKVDPLAIWRPPIPFLSSV